MGFMPASSIASNLCLIINNSTLYHFGILNSTMHMTWLRFVGGRLKSDYRYSNDIVYNNYPWPDEITESQKNAIGGAGQKILDTRKEFPENSLADLYDPVTMPPSLVKAHQALDKVVDSCYRSQPFLNETNRIEFLFDLYEKYTADLFTKDKAKKKKKSNS